MKVRELLALLRQAPPEACVLFLDAYAGRDEADEVREVFVPETAWTHERGRFGADEYAVRYPHAPEPRGAGYRDVTYVAERVVVLSTGTTNLRSVTNQ